MADCAAQACSFLPTSKQCKLLRSGHADQNASLSWVSGWQTHSGVFPQCQGIQEGVCLTRKGNGCRVVQQRAFFPARAPQPPQLLLWDGIACSCCGRLVCLFARVCNLSLVGRRDKQWCARVPGVCRHCSSRKLCVDRTALYVATCKSG